MFFFSKKTKYPWISAVVAAGGSASRMDGIDKQLALIDELPVVVRSVEALSNCPLIGEIVLVCPGGQVSDYYTLVRDYGLERVSSVVGGGQTRQDSVFAGVGACREQAEYFVIHDGARPLVTPEIVLGCIEAAMEHGAAAAGVRLKDTVKLVGPDGCVADTPDREKLAAIQTPQVFAAELYRQAMALAQKEALVYTDDCQLIERIGGKIRIVPGSYENIKITTPEDLAVASAVLRFREEGTQEWQLCE